MDTAVSKTCEQCGQGFTPKRRVQRFCHANCRAAWHKANGCSGRIVAIRELARGGYSVIAHFPSAPALQPGTRVRLEAE